MGSEHTGARLIGALATAALLVTAPVTGASASEDPPDDAWTRVELGTSRTDGLDLAVRPGAIAIAHTPPDEDGAGLEYLWCTSECHQSDAWQRTRLVSGRFVQQVSLALDPWGRPHLAYRDGRDLVYRTCAHSCRESSSWSSVTIEQLSGSDRWGGALAGVSLALDSWGRPRIAYIDEDGDAGEPGGALEFASCDADCESPDQWSIIQLTVPGTSDAARPELAYVGTRPRLVHTEGGGARTVVYAACEKDCLGPDQWHRTRLPVSAGSSRSHYGLRFDRERPRLAVADNQRAAYLECDTECTNIANWSSAAVVDPGTHADHVDLTLTRDGPRVAYVRDQGGWLHAGDCTTPCTASERWEPISFPALTGPARIAADGDRLRIASVIHPSDRSPGKLRLFLCDAACGAPGDPPTPPGGTPAASTSTFPVETVANQSAAPTDDATPPISGATDKTVSDLFSGADSRASSDAAKRGTSRTTRRFELRPHHGGAGQPGSGGGPSIPNGLTPGSPPAAGPRIISPPGSLTGALVSLAALVTLALAGMMAFRLRRSAHRLAGDVIADRHQRTISRR